MADVPKLIDTLMYEMETNDYPLRPLIMLVLMCKSKELLKKYADFYGIHCDDGYPTSRFVQEFLRITEKTAINLIKSGIDRGWVEQLESTKDHRVKYIKATKKLDDLNYKLSIL